MDVATGAGTGGVTRRQLLRMIGLGAGSAVMYQAMTSLGLAAESGYSGPPQIGQAPPGASVLILGAGIAGMVAAMELRDAGYTVQVLEFNDRPGGRNWTLRGGDRYTELGGETQTCGFDEGQYFNPGPWRLPYHHHGILHYCKRLGVALENFVQINHNAFLHSQNAFGGKPQRYRPIQADYHGHVAELLSKAAQGGGIDQLVSEQDKQILLASLQWWGALDNDYRYVASHDSSDRRGFARDPGGGIGGKPEFSQPLKLDDLLRSGLWGNLPLGALYDMQTTLMQPVGGMGRIGEAFGRELGSLIRYRCKVTRIEQTGKGVTAHFSDIANGGTAQSASADWCVCTIPLSILSQIPMNVGAPMQTAIRALPYAPAVKLGLQFKRRFWEEDDHIYGGISFTDLPIGNIGYPQHGYHSQKGVLLGGYLWGTEAMRFTGMSPAQRIQEGLAQGTKIHPQYPTEFENGVAVAWHREPGTMGCFANWTDALREEHYDNLCAFDGRIVLAGEHASYIPAWQEGAVTSALNAIERLHRRATAQGGAA
ncbi:MAG: flavin monoamine oxidase family protein [Lysobacteraceae bacterium]